MPPPVASPYRVVPSSPPPPRASEGEEEESWVAPPPLPHCRTLKMGREKRCRLCRRAVSPHVPLRRALQKGGRRESGVGILMSGP
ncbi:hypothetical protein [Oryza sativa Japonica Group]|uniref:Uncharacterized protein n=1 Tax=Oryza sativa subsp. japonica TaxID=39947 RepID=Q5ZAL7_ORYSJ|nr:hypothetical protein [Oryza sativa Japonica Group]BAD53377.1 hypothetical protein [Oryza sativa Japonica Group]